MTGEVDEGNYGGISDMIASKIMDSLGIEQEHIDKGKEIMDMIKFTKADGDNILIVSIGKNIEVKIKV